MSIRCLFIVLLLASGSIALGRKNSTTGDENAIRQADREWSASSNIHDLDKFLSFYADDASVLPFNALLVSGKDVWRKRAATWKAVADIFNTDK